MAILFFVFWQNVWKWSLSTICCSFFRIALTCSTLYIYIYMHIYYLLSMKMTASFVGHNMFTAVYVLWSGSNIWHQYREPGHLICDAQTCFLNVYVLLWMCVFINAGMKYPVWDCGVNSTDWPFCCRVTNLWLQGMANGCRPCYMFSISSIQHLSTQGCILIYSPVPLPLPPCRAQHQSTPWPIVGHCNHPGLSEG